MVWREKKDLALGSYGRWIKRIGRMPNARVRKLCGVKKGVNERIDATVIRWFVGRVERMKNSRIGIRASEGDCIESRSRVRKVD